MLGGETKEIIVEKDDNKGYGWNSMWIFALVILFLAIIFLWKRDEGRHTAVGIAEGALPALAAGFMSRQSPAIAGMETCISNSDGHREHWDNDRDTLKEFGSLKYELATQNLMQSREMDKGFADSQRVTMQGFCDQFKENARYFSEQQKDMLLGFKEQEKDTLRGFKDAEIQNLNTTRELLARIEALDKRQDQEIIRKQGEEINYLKTVMALQPRPPMPAYFPNYSIPVQHNIYSCEPGAYPAHG